MRDFSGDRAAAEAFRSAAEGVRSEALDDAVKTVMEAACKYVARDALGAWRAGYDYLDVYTTRADPPEQTVDYRGDVLDEMTVQIGVRCVPRDRTPVAPPVYNGTSAARRIDLRQITPDQIDRVREALR